MGKDLELDTIWEVPDGLWGEIRQVLDEPRRVGGGPAGRGWTSGVR